MDDPFYRKSIILCCKRLYELNPLGACVTTELPYESCVNLLSNSIDDDKAISSCVNNILIWNILLYCLRSLSTPIIPFELVNEMPINLELVCLIIAKMDKDDNTVLQAILETINIILFPDLRVDVEDTNTSFVSETGNTCNGAYFPHIISTIGYSLCRPAFSAFMSIRHKKGFDEIGQLLTLLLDNRRCLFSLRISLNLPPIPVQNDSQWKQRKNGILYRSKLPSEIKTITTHSVSLDTLASYLQSAIQLNSCQFQFTNIPTYKEVLRRIAIINTRIQNLTSFLNYNSQPIVPRSLNQNAKQYMTHTQLEQLIALSNGPIPSSDSIQLQSALKYNEEYNIEHINTNVISSLHKQQDHYAAILIQSIIRRKSCFFVFSVHYNQLITKLPPRPKCCLFCCINRKELLINEDYSSYFTETDWLLSTTQLALVARADLIQYILALQLQLLEIEKRITCNNKVRAIASNSYLMSKYSYYHKIINLLYSIHYNCLF